MENRRTVKTSTNIEKNTIKTGHETVLWLMVGNK